MNARQLFLGWVRTTHPQVYARAMRLMFAPHTALSGLGDDLTSTIDVGSNAGLSDSESQSLAQAASDTAAQGNSWADIFTGVANTITAVAPAIVQTEAQQNLLQINTQRAQQGLPPLTYINGVPVSAASLAPATGATAQLEAALGGGGSIFLIGGALVLGLLLLGGKKSAG